MLFLFLQLQTVMSLLLTGGELTVQLEVVVDNILILGIHIGAVSQVLLIVMALLIVTTIFRLLLHFLEIAFIPESAIVILIGCVTGFILWGATVGLDTIIPTLDLFFLVLIPPIIFEAGYHLDKTAFMHNIRIILLLAVVGTGLAAAITGLLIWAAAPLYKESMDVAEALVYGSLISAVDPVAVLAIFDEVHVNETLNIVVFGESVLNDAVSIVFYNLFLDLSRAPSFTAAVPFLGLLRFTYVSFGGAIMGLLFALGGSFLTKFTGHGETHLLETLILLITGYASYLVSEVFLMSGIIAILFCGILLQRYAESNIHRKSRTTFKYMIKIIASTMDVIIFLMLGIVTVYHCFGADGGDVDARWDPALICLTLAIILPLRFFLVFSLSWLSKFWRIKPLGYRDQFIMAYGGLRGAIAFALAFALEAEDYPARDIVITATLVVVWFTVFIQGTTIKPLLNLLNVRRSTTLDRPLSIMERAIPNSFDPIKDAIRRIAGNYQAGTVTKFFLAMDRFFASLVVRGLYSEEKQLVQSMRRLRKHEINRQLDEVEEAQRMEVFRQDLANPKVNLHRVMAERDPVGVMSTPLDLVPETASDDEQVVEEGLRFLQSSHQRARPRNRFAVPGAESVADYSALAPVRRRPAAAAALAVDTNDFEMRLDGNY